MESSSYQAICYFKPCPNRWGSWVLFEQLKSYAPFLRSIAFSVDRLFLVSQLAMTAHKEDSLAPEGIQGDTLMLERYTKAPEKDTSQVELFEKEFLQGCLCPMPIANLPVEISFFGSRGVIHNFKLELVGDPSLRAPTCSATYESVPANGETSQDSPSFFKFIVTLPKKNYEEYKSYLVHNLSFSMILRLDSPFGMYSKINAEDDLEDSVKALKILTQSHEIIVDKELTRMFPEFCPPVLSAKNKINGFELVLTSL